MGAIVVLVGEGEEKNKRHIIMLFLWSEVHLTVKCECVTWNAFKQYSLLPLACMIEQLHQREAQNEKSFFLLGVQFYGLPLQHWISS